MLIKDHERTLVNIALLHGLDIRDCVHCEMKWCPSVLDAHIIHFLLFTPQIHRSKNKWKFHLKDGIMNLNGRDYVFSKAIGDAEW